MCGIGGPLCVKLGFNAEILGKQAATAEIKCEVIFMIFIVFYTILESLPVYFLVVSINAKKHIKPHLICRPFYQRLVVLPISNYPIENTKVG